MWLLLLLPAVAGWRVQRPWTEQQWCLSVVDPHYPISYSKYATQPWERQGQNSDAQDVRHECAAFGAESKCHVCERIACGNGSEVCEYQLQGVAYQNMSTNIPTASDSPWAIGGAHRFDYGGAAHVCVVTSGGNCTSPLASDLSTCATRCWGVGETGLEPSPLLSLDAGARAPVTDVWEYKARATSQGSVFTLAGVAKRAGFVDGPASRARFRFPSGVAIDALRNVYIADTGNHAIRVFENASQRVHTLAGALIGEAGSGDGPAASARFSAPRGLALTYEPFDQWGKPEALVLYVADTGNHRIRKIRFAGLGRDAAVVECFAGRCGAGSATYEATLSAAPPEPGFADGTASWAAFDGPRGVAVHSASGDVIVADTNNHLIRVVNATGSVFTLAGHLEALGSSPGCPPPCLGGAMGGRDGNVSFAKFSSPQQVAIDTVATAHAQTTGFYTILVTEGARIRRVVPAAGFFHSRYEFDGGILTEGGQVYTVAGGRGQGRRDGSGDEATFEQPAGIVSAQDGHVYVADASSCRLRRISPPKLSVSDLFATFGSAQKACSARLVDVVRPDGCAAYEAPVGFRGLKVTARQGHVHYNAMQRFENGPGKAEDFGPEFVGRSSKRCVGSPPPDSLDKRAWETGENLALDDLQYALHDDSGAGTALRFRCPPGCGEWAVGAAVGAAPASFADESAICAAALFSGAIGDEGGLVTVDVVHGARSISEEAWTNGFQTAAPPFAAPTLKPTTASGTTPAPTAVPTLSPAPTRNPTALPTPAPSPAPTATPRPSATPSSAPSPVSARPSISARPSSAPTSVPTLAPAAAPSSTPTATPAPTSTASAAPSRAPTRRPTAFPPAVPKNASLVATFASLYGSWASNGPDLVERLFRVSAYEESAPWEVQTVAGSPAAPLSDACGYQDGWPPLSAAFHQPQGVALYQGAAGASDFESLVVADSANHVIRGVTAVCSQPCENGGACVGPEACACQSGWAGHDCSRPTCRSTSVFWDNASISCSTAANALCVAPNQCACAPGWAGAACSTALCVQSCGSGECVAPDTCGCAPGWFDGNCTTPVCHQTCGNGGNCTNPGECTCPLEWSGHDCRRPNCAQECSNGGQCVAPNTCQCPPTWQGIDCTLPVCSQGFFIPSLSDAWPTYRPCDFGEWCNQTNGFDCGQPGRAGVPLEVPSGGAFRRITGRSRRPLRCDVVELRPSAVSHFGLARADNSTTFPARYSPMSPYNWRAVGKKWRANSGPLDGGSGKTRPWNRKADRQVAFVEWVNVSQGLYVCANGGACSEPDVCTCASGWVGFDCRTPVCDQGSYDPQQSHFVSGTESPGEIESFRRFMDPAMAAHRLQWPYSNPDFSMVDETFETFAAVSRSVSDHAGERYAGQTKPQGGYRCSIRARTRWEKPGPAFDHVNFYSRYMDAATQLDGVEYTNWTGLAWPPTHGKTRKLELQHSFQGKTATYVYTDQGHLRDGVWFATGEEWAPGTCVVEFKRVCGAGFEAADPKNVLVPQSSEGWERDFGWDGENVDEGKFKARAFVDKARFPGDVSSARLVNVAVQDTDFAYRARMRYDSSRESGRNRWFQRGGECVDTVLRGCHNNGTCVSPNQCDCAQGWSGYDCTIPVCSQVCKHHGNCTLPETCTCERGWAGRDCAQPVCAQECAHGGSCVAPDTCKCTQYESHFPTGHDVPRPFFRTPSGAAQRTGWTGFDCSVPICVQALKFTLNVGPAEKIRSAMQENVALAVGATSYAALNYVELGGRGFDGREDVDVAGVRKLKCDAKPRCPSYNDMVTANVGESFPRACGFDVLDTGCCARDYASEADSVRAIIAADPHDKAYVDVGRYACSVCPQSARLVSAHNFTCVGHDMFSVEAQVYLYSDIPEAFFYGRLPRREVRLCGASSKQLNFQEVISERPAYFEAAQLPNVSSALFLCGVASWEQGDYVDDAGLGQAEGVGVDYGPRGALAHFEFGRHVRVNSPNIVRSPGANAEDDVWAYGETLRGEGVYECLHGGSCISPDVCTCADGWAGDDCATPLCRHLQTPTAKISGCENGAVCKFKDTCECIQTPSVLKAKYSAEAAGGTTGWSGTDCSRPVCVQGFYDAFCADLPQAPGGEGCYRCSNGGNCTAPDVCSCAAGWQGFDCKTPKCEVVASPLQRAQLDTDDANKVDLFERNPCSLVGVNPPEPWPRSYAGVGAGGFLALRGNCTAPNECACWCKASYNAGLCDRKFERNRQSDDCRGPFQDMLGSTSLGLLDLVNYRDLLEPYEAFGTRSCRLGYEGTVSEEFDRFTTCHLKIFVPTRWEAWTLTIVACSSLFSVLAALAYTYIRRKMKQKYLLAKIERRRSRRSSEESQRASRTKRDAFKTT